ncbi:uncharacterized protein LOC135837152 [Planococcus citri]|uniref:uncharacterized protein LOC135837152 n=1 Tax=Planococcus citri TaxID=170843 RepID=UPI0031F72438
MTSIKNYVLVMAEVKHSQKLNEKNLVPCVLINDEPKIICAGCTCIAGLDEACSHVGAILYYLLSLAIQKTSATDTTRTWGVPSQKFKLLPKKIGNINFVAAVKRKRNPELKAKKQITFKKYPAEKIHDLANLQQFLQGLEPSNPNCSAFSVVPPFQQNLARKIAKFPLIYNRLYTDENLSLNYDELVEKGKNLNFNLTISEIAQVELNTRKQSHCDDWFKIRKGRITASIVKEMCAAQGNFSNMSLIKKICYGVKFSNAATDWGCKHESDGINKYFSVRESQHYDLEVAPSGFFIHHAYFHLGATPDQLVRCACCGIGILEIKCPFCLRNKKMADLLYLEESNGSLSLRKNHNYHYQVQLQLMCCDVPYGDFLVWSESEEPFIQRIYPDRAVQQEIIQKSSAFFHNSILPELLARYGSRLRKLQL